jgi:hypothetical protein
MRDNAIIGFMKNASRVINRGPHTEGIVSNRFIETKKARPHERIAIYPNWSEAERRDRLCVELCGFACFALDSVHNPTCCRYYPEIQFSAAYG